MNFRFKIGDTVSLKKTFEFFETFELQYLPNYDFGDGVICYENNKKFNYEGERIYEAAIFFNKIKNYQIRNKKINRAYIHHFSYNEVDNSNNYVYRKRIALTEKKYKWNLNKLKK